MKSIAILFICLSLSGCFSQSIDQADINRASSYCGSSKNISKIKSLFHGLRVYCFDKVGVWGQCLLKIQFCNKENI